METKTGEANMTEATAAAAESKKAAKAKAAAEEKARAEKAATALARTKALEAAANIFGMDIKNSCDQLVTACVHDHVQIIQNQFKLLETRVVKAREQLTAAGIF